MYCLRVITKSVKTKDTAMLGSMRNIHTYYVIYFWNCTINKAIMRYYAVQSYGTSTVVSTFLVILKTKKARSCSIQTHVELNA